MAVGMRPDDISAKEWAQIQARNRARQAGTYVAPPTTPDTTIKPVKPGSGGGGGGGTGGGGGGGISAAESNARKAGKDSSRKQNEATQAIINSLLDSLGGFESGRETQISNANRAYDQGLAGILANYAAAVADYDATGQANEEDQVAKTAANLTNRARERVSLLQQAASQGAGETDQLRAQIQAFLNADANQQEVDRGFFDTQRSINSQIAGANSQAESQRRSAWNQREEAIGNAWNEFWKNTGDVWTNIQRTGAGNTNVASDYSEAFNADYRGNDPVKKAAEAAGKTYTTRAESDDFFRNFDGRKEGRDTKVASTNRAAAATIKAPKAAEGATLRGRGF